MPGLLRHTRGSGPRTARRAPGLLRPLFAAAALVFLMADNGIGRDEFLCEAAVAHLANCCRDFPVQSLYCVRSGCDGKVVPDIDEDRAQCLRHKSCEELQALGACEPGRWELVPSCVTPCSPKVPSCY